MAVLCQPHLQPLYQALPFAIHLFPFNRSEFRKNPRYRADILGALKAWGPDLALNGAYSRDTTTDALALGSEAPYRITWASLASTPWKIRLADACYSHLIPDHRGTELERNRHFSKGIGLDGSAMKPALTIPASARERAKRVIESQGIKDQGCIALFAGAQHPERLYPHYGRALRTAFPEKEIPVIALGAAGDRTINQHCLEEYGGQSLNLSGELSLLESAAVLERCTLGFGAETGLAHVACALEVPQVVLLGGGHFGRFMPYSDLTTIASTPLACFGCNWRCRFSRPHCVQDVPVQVLAAALRSAWGKSSNAPRGFYPRLPAQPGPGACPPESLPNAPAISWGLVE